MYIFLSFKVEKCLIYQVLQGLSIISGHLINSAQTFEFDDKLLEVTLEKKSCLISCGIGNKAEFKSYNSSSFSTT